MGKGVKHLLIRAAVAGNRLFATSSKTKSTEQLDIDKKNGALAYVPFTTDFEITPLAGIAFVFILMCIDKELLNEEGKEKSAADEETSRVNREVMIITFINYS